MTSSLVGSEMCIRDSSYAAQPVPWCNKQAGNRPWTEAPERGFYEEWAEWLQEMDVELQLRFG
eukprot:9972645-Prorocentrum_lima.AAC.1